MLLETILRDEVQDIVKKKVHSHGVELRLRGTIWFALSTDDINRRKDGKWLGHISDHLDCRALLVRIGNEVELEAKLRGAFGITTLTIVLPAHLTLHGFGANLDGKKLEEVMTEGEYYDAQFHNCDYVHAKKGK